jgi:hypothetical protein
MSRDLFCQNTNAYFEKYQVPRKNKQINFLIQKLEAETLHFKKLVAMDYEPFKG